MLHRALEGAQSPGAVEADSNVVGRRTNLDVLSLELGLFCHSDDGCGTAALQDGRGRPSYIAARSSEPRSSAILCVRQ